MRHIPYAEKSLLVGEEAAVTLMKYAALLAQHQSGDSVELNAIGVDGSTVGAMFLLDSGANIMAETTESTLPEPDNTDAIALMRERIARLESPPAVRADDQDAVPLQYDDFDLR